MGHRRGILLTGATGLVGRFLLRELLVAGHQVALLVRDAAGVTAAERVAELLPANTQPVLLAGDLTHPGLGLPTADRRWLAGHCGAILHSAANVSYKETPEGEPWETNVNGTRRLAEMCQAIGIEEFHHLSTAFLCGDRRGRVLEDELDCGSGSTNAYERSKFAAEQFLRQIKGIRLTVYRPSVVVGDSRTGYTSTYHHLYRFLELAVRLSGMRGDSALAAAPRRRRLAIRLPLSGEETQNLVPVDWVAQAVVRLLERPHWHGRTFHLAGRQDVRLDEIKQMIEELVGLEGVTWAGLEGFDDPSPLERLVLEQFENYWAYLRGRLTFDCRNTRRALPDLPPPAFDRALLQRLLRFAVADQWGRGRRPEPVPQESPHTHYLEQFLPERAQHFLLTHQLPIDLHFALDIRGPGGGRWTYRLAGGVVVEQKHGPDTGAAVVYRTDAATFARLVRGRQTLQEAFFEGRIEIDGDLERALKLAFLFQQFLAEYPYPSFSREENRHALAG
jgi:thioester reductase-like protein